MFDGWRGQRHLIFANNIYCINRLNLLTKNYSYYLCKALWGIGKKMDTIMYSVLFQTIISLSTFRKMEKIMLSRLMIKAFLFKLYSILMQSCHFWPFVRKCYLNVQCTQAIRHSTAKIYYSLISIWSVDRTNWMNSHKNVDW